MVKISNSLVKISNISVKISQLSVKISKKNRSSSHTYGSKSLTFQSKSRANISIEMSNGSIKTSSFSVKIWYIKSPFYVVAETSVSICLQYFDDQIKANISSFVLKSIANLWWPNFPNFSTCWMFWSKSHYYVDKNN